MNENTPETDGTVADHGPEPFYMPAEWQPHDGTWLSWPHNANTWAQNLQAAQNEFRQLVETIAQFETVFLIVRPTDFDHLSFQSTNIQLIPISTNDAWARDYAPTFVRNDGKTLRSIDWYYNAWGGKYPPYDEDQKVAHQIARRLNIENQKVDLCLEGGALEINDQRTLITTRSCLLADNRNPSTTQSKAESVLRKHLGARSVVWLPGDAIEGDDTDGHIDQLARFTNNDTLVHAWTRRSDDRRREAIGENIHVLKTSMATLQPEIRLIELPLPEPIDYCDLRLPASYCNFLIVNGGVIVPQFDQPDADADAVSILQSCFTNRKVVPLPSKNLTVGLGSFHCLSQQQPSVE
jgi:agmatine deiminase